MMLSSRDGARQGIDCDSSQRTRCEPMNPDAPKTVNIALYLISTVA